jgi:hypothetical protein
MTRRSAAGWGQASGWGAAPGRGLPVATDPLPLRAAGSLGRWLWPISAVAGFLAIVGYVFGNDDSRPGLSDRGWLALILAVVVLVVLTVRRAAGPGPLARTLTEYALVGLLAALLATAGAGQQPAEHVQDGARQQPAQQAEDSARRHQPAERSANRRQATEHADTGAADRRPGIVRVVTGVGDWLAGLWRDAGQQTDRRTPPTSTTAPR